jgi:signal transduction histidine kinase
LDYNISTERPYGRLERKPGVGKTANMNRHPRKPDVKAYLISIALVFAASIITITVTRFYDGRAPLVFFTIAVVLSAAYGGLGPGLLATGLSVAVIFPLFQRHILVLVLSHSSLALFALIAVVITVAMDRLQRNNKALAQVRRELEYANEQLSRQAEGLLRSNDELRRFAHALAHDLHTPIRNVSTLTEDLLQRNAGAFDDRSKECARLIATSVRRMNTMIGDLLDYAVATAGRPQQTLTDCNGVVRRVLEDLRRAVENSAAAVTVGPLPVIAANESHLIQVFSNLLGNAIKYRSNATPEVRIWAERQEKDWLFAVADNGIGLDMRYAEEIFGMLRRLHTADTYEGTGIGLTLCKAVIQGYGGRIWVESALGKGSTFFFTVPTTAVCQDEGASRETELHAAGTLTTAAVSMKRRNLPAN